MNDAQPHSSPEPDLKHLERLHAIREQIRNQIGRTIVGQEEVIDLLLVSIFTGGHCMLEGVPGLAKTLLVSSLAETLSLSFARIQFTPDLMPSDITGTEVMHEDRASGAREFKFMQGPIFNGVILADEINRTPPKTQAALLEGMQERQVSTGGKRFPLPEPFFVLATQNPIEQEGTYPLPEAQLDRFLMKVIVDYPAREEERQIYRLTSSRQRQAMEPVVGAEEILELQQVVDRIPVADFVLDYALTLIRATRPGDSEAPDFVNEWVSYGAGPRGGQALITAGKTRAALAGRPEVSMEDLHALAAPVLRHRLVLNYNAEAEGQTPDSVVERLLQTLPSHASTPDLDGQVQQILKP